jgi:hypothetical protein
VGLANLGSESETCVGSRFRLVGVSNSFEKNFYQLPFTPPPSLGCCFCPSSRPTADVSVLPVADKDLVLHVQTVLLIRLPRLLEDELWPLLSSIAINSWPGSLRMSTLGCVGRNRPGRRRGLSGVLEVGPRRSSTGSRAIKIRAVDRGAKVGRGDLEGMQASEPKGCEGNPIREGRSDL